MGHGTLYVCIGNTRKSWLNCKTQLIHLLLKKKLLKSATKQCFKITNRAIFQINNFLINDSLILYIYNNLIVERWKILTLHIYFWKYQKVYLSDKTLGHLCLIIEAMAKLMDKILLHQIKDKILYCTYHVMILVLFMQRMR